jgi:hypothetical protein
MRTMFFEMDILNDTSFMNNAYFIWNKKEWERERERQRETVAEKGLWCGS